MLIIHSERETGLTSPRTTVKEQVLHRAEGCCERCGKPFGGRHHFHYRGYPVLHADNLTVVCETCHHEVLTQRHEK